MRRSGQCPILDTLAQGQSEAGTSASFSKGAGAHFALGLALDGLAATDQATAQEPENLDAGLALASLRGRS